MKLVAENVLYVGIETSTFNGNTIKRVILVDEQDNYERTQVTVDDNILSSLPHPKTHVSVKMQVVQRNYKTYINLLEIKPSRKTEKAV